MAKKTMETKKLDLEATAKRLEEAYKLQGKLEIIIEIQDRFGTWKSGDFFATAKEWTQFTKLYIEQKV